MTKIEWCDESWNPITGCSPISAGCNNCYARRMANRLKGRFGYPANDPFKITFHPDRLDQPLKWKKPRQIFVCSMGDLFHEEIEDHQINSIFLRMVNIDWHTYMILTKRPERMKDFISIGTGWRGMMENIWFGVTAENQQTADDRIPILLQTPAAVRFVSVEPMLERVNPFSGKYLDINNPQWIDWVICGPETGPGARECKPEWIESLYEQCKAAGVPFFDKRKNYLAREFPEGA